jgi:hypothetical protein
LAIRRGGGNAEARQAAAFFVGAARRRNVRLWIVGKVLLGKPVILSAAKDPSGVFRFP